jgi:PAS domain S-box-containing protein
MDTDRNLVLAVLALQTGLIDAKQFIEVCALWTTRKDVPLAQLLVERGWMVPGDVAHLEYLTERRLTIAEGDVRATLVGVPDDLKRSLARLEDPEIRQSLAGLPGSSENQTTMDLASGRRERFALTRLYATGGIGQVWVARDTDLDRDVALKELRPEKASNPAHRERFLREARITGLLEHPGVVPIYELSHRPEDQEPFYTMRLVKGRTLTEAAEEFHRKRMTGTLDWLQFAALLNAFVTVCNTIAFAHSRGVVHRDLKGRNVILGDFGEVVLLDWGLAKLVARPDEIGRSQDPQELDAAGLTLVGQMMGTPAFMAPEQAAGHPGLIDFRTDVYGLGATLYEILTGQAPFSGRGANDILRKVCEESPRPPHEIYPEVPAQLEQACLRALAKSPTERYSGALELAQEVQSWQEVQRRQAEEERDRFFTLSLDMLCICGFDGFLQRLNPAWERTLGHTLDEMMSRPFLDFVHPDDRESTLGEFAKLINESHLTLTFENRYRCKDGSYRWLLWTATPYHEGTLVYAAARDITERKSAEEALRENEARYRAVIAAMQNGIVLLDAKGGIYACNESAERILGLSADQMVGRTPLDPRWRAIHEDGSPFPGETLPAALTLRNGKPYSDVTIGIHRPDGTLAWISVNSRPLFGPDEQTLHGAVASFLEITGQKQTQEELRTTMVELEQAHREIRTLLSRAQRE